MDKLFNALRTALAGDPFRERILVVHSLTAAHQLRRRLAVDGTPWVNLRCATPPTLANELATADLDRRGLLSADDTMTFLLVAELLPAVTEAKAYLAQVTDTPGTLRAIHRTITELRLHAAKASDLPLATLDAAKGRALEALLSAYERELERRNWADYAEVLRTATKSVSPLGEPVYLLPRGLCARGLERAFLEALPASSTVVLDQDEALGLPAPSSRLDSAAVDPGAPSGPLGNLFSSGNTRVPGIYVFSAVAPVSEVREALRRLLQAKIPLEDAEFLLAREEPYVQAVQELATRMEVPVTFAGGIPALWTRPGRAAASLAAWFGDGFLARRLADGLAEGDIKLPGDAAAQGISARQVARVLRRAAIGWGRERYEPALRALLAPGDPEDGDAEEPDWLARRRRQVEQALAVAEGLLASAPVADPDGCVEFASTCGWLAEMLVRFAGVAGQEDAAALDALVERLKLGSQWATGAFPPPAAAERALALVEDVRIGASGPRPGHLHVTGASRPSASGRSHSYVLGLDEGTFAVGGASDPLLLDEERTALPVLLPTSADLAVEALYRLGLTLSERRGEVTLSFSVRDPAADRAQFPSPVLLQAYRLAVGQPNANYGELSRSVGIPAAYAPLGGGLPLDADEAWLSLIARNSVLANARAAVIAAHPLLARGKQLLDGRRSLVLTPFDGQIGADTAPLDPRRNPDLVMSASRLELLAKCPLAYFFRYVLEINPLEEIGRDPSRWLDATQRGALLHQVYRSFYERLGTRPTGDPREEALMAQVCTEAITQKRTEVPPPGEAVFVRETAELLAASRAFLAYERADVGAGRPVLMELAFGFGPGSVAKGSPGSETPVAIPLLAGGSLTLRGRIDRVDQTEGHHYRVWDYKTGRAYPEGGTTLAGTRLQPGLYALAVEALLREGGFDAQAEVELAGYRFPTERGEGQTWLPEGNDPVGESLGAVADLLELVRTGTFVPAGDEQACKYCEFAGACEGQVAVEMIREVQTTGAEARLVALGRLRDRA